MSGWGSKDWANDQLRFAIEDLRKDGSCCLVLALVIRDRLVDAGFWWQARTLEFWIHRFQGGEFTRGA